MDNRREWIKDLGTLSAAVAAVTRNNTLPDVSYRSGLTDHVTKIDAFNFANDDNHKHALARCFDNLKAQGVAEAILFKYLKDLTSGRNTYGTVSELLVYLWLMDHRIPFGIQVPLTGADVLNPAGTELDGKLLISPGVFFDIKAFGLSENLVQRLQKRIAADIPDKWIAIEGSWDISINMAEDLLRKRQYEQLLLELINGDSARRGPLHFIKREKRRVQTTSRGADAYELAKENASYAFRFAKQFCRNDPFIIFLAYHPWLGGLSLATDFADSTSTFTRALARRTFIQFLDDTFATFDVTRGEASKLISGMAFLNISRNPRRRDAKSGPTLRLYLNPNAKNPVSPLAVAHICRHDPSSVAVEDFVHDNY